LACTSIEFRHPQDGRVLAIEAPPEDSFAKVASALGWDGIRDRARPHPEVGAGDTALTAACA
jgi:hypothetical protein